jgi:hypothetical protein
MPRVVTPTLVSRTEACHHLGIVPRTFSRHWKSVFTDPRSPERRVQRVERSVYDDELREAVLAGGGVEPKAKGAVLMLRKALGRTDTREQPR